ncbi:MAG: 50S ribosomal protein L29 [Acidimicrobiales bacterium]
MTKPSELRILTDNERAQRLDEARKELFNLRFQLATGRLDNVSRIAVLRRDIARLMTLEREQSAAAPARKRPRRRRG